MNDAGQTECEHACRLADLAFESREHAFLIVRRLVSGFEAGLCLPAVFGYSDSLGEP